MIEMLCMAILMRWIQHRPRAERLDSDGLTYAWHDLGWELGCGPRVMSSYLDDPNAEFKGRDWLGAS